MRMNRWNAHKTQRVVKRSSSRQKISTITRRMAPLLGNQAILSHDISIERLFQASLFVVTLIAIRLKMQVTHKYMYLLVLSSSVGLSGWCRLQPFSTVVNKNSSLSDKNKSILFHDLPDKSTITRQMDLTSQQENCLSTKAQVCTESCPQEEHV